MNRVLLMMLGMLATALAVVILAGCGDGTDGGVPQEDLAAPPPPPEDRPDPPQGPDPTQGGG